VLSLGAYFFYFAIALHSYPRVDLKNTASGLLWISELIEEYSRLAKRWGQRGVYVRRIHSFRPIAGFSPMAVLSFSLSLTGHHRTTPHLLVHRQLTTLQDPLLRLLPPRLPPKLLSSLAPHLAHLPVLPRVLRLGRSESLHLVLLLLSAGAGGAPSCAPSVRETRIRPSSTYVWRDRDVLHALRMDRPPVLVPKSKRE
jgi:hypothetical protein